MVLIASMGPMGAARLTAWCLIVFKDASQPVNKFIRIQRLFQAYGYVLPEGLLQFGMKLTFRQRDDTCQWLFALQIPERLVGHPDIVQVQDNGTAIAGTQVWLQFNNRVHLDRRKMLAFQEMAKALALTPVTIKNDDLFFHSMKPLNQIFSAFCLNWKNRLGKTFAIAVPLAFCLEVCCKVVEKI
jgi:hypothetical protein